MSCSPKSFKSSFEELMQHTAIHTFQIATLVPISVPISVPIPLSVLFIRGRIKQKSKGSLIRIASSFKHHLQPFLPPSLICFSNCFSCC